MGPRAVMGHILASGLGIVTAFAFGTVGVAVAVDSLPIDLPTSLGGASGWTGVGLLGVVLYWIAFKYIPDQRDQMTTFVKNKDEQMSVFIKDKDVQIQALTKINADATRDIVERFTHAFEEQRNDFREMLGLPRKTIA